MQYDKLLELLSRGDVKELALQTDRPACVLVGEQYTPVMKANLTEDDIIATAIGAGGRNEVLQLLSGPRRWDYEHPTLGMLRIFAGYHGPRLQVRVKLVSPPAGRAQAPARDSPVPAQPTRGQPPAPPSRASSTAHQPVAARASSAVHQPVGDAAPGRRERPQFAPPDVPRRAPAAASATPATFNPFEADAAAARGAGDDFGDMPPLMNTAPTGAARRPTMEREQQNGARRPTQSDGAPPRRPTLDREPQRRPGSDDPFAADDASPAQDPSFDDLVPPESTPPAPEQQQENVPANVPRPRAHQAEYQAPPSGSPGAEFEKYLRIAREKAASDLHILGDRPVMLRIGGDLVPQGGAVPASYVEQMILPQIPPRARADLDAHGACDFSLIHPSLGRFRANATRQRTGMKLTARPISEHVPTLAELGLPESISLATEHHQGLIVVTGPTGHGKTTTLAAIVDIVNRTRAHHVITVEDPIEYVHPRKKAMMSQREVGSHTKAFAAALKGSLREDPDVIVVGELRDTDTVRMALSAAETGHLVISTMNTPSAAKAIERIIDLFPPGDQPQVRMTLAGGLRLVVSQRLVPSADRKSMHAAVELLPGSSALWALIRDNKTFQIPSLQQRGKALGIIRLDDSLADLVRAGKTSLEIAREFAESPDQFEALVQGKAARPADQVVTMANLDPTKEAAQAAQKFGKDMLSKAGKLFGDKK